METYKVTIELTKAELRQAISACVHMVTNFENMGIKMPDTRKLTLKLMDYMNEIDNGPF